MKIRTFFAAAAVLVASTLCSTPARAFDFFGLTTSYQNLKVVPPRMLYWWAIWSNKSDAFICEKMRTGEVIEADEAALAKAKALNCGFAYGGDWLRYTVLVTWNCPTMPGQTCPYWKNTIFGFEEGVPAEALLHWKTAGSKSCTLNGVPNTITWSAGDPVDILHTEQYAGYPTLCDGYYSRRGPGVHLLVNPEHPWVVEAIKRYAATRVGQGYSRARSDETYLIDSADPNLTAEFAGRPKSYHGAWNSRLKDMRGVPGWKTMCPSVGDWYKPESMNLARAGGCISSEGMFGGGGIVPNMGKKTIADLRGMYGSRLQNVEAGDAEVPNNVLLAIRYENTERNVRSASNLAVQARASNAPNLDILADCADVVTAYGADLQAMVGNGGDRIMCIDHWSSLSDANGNVPMWFMGYNQKPTWAP